MFRRIYGAKIDFTAAGRTVTDSALVVNWNLISGGANATYTLTVNPDQAAGVYRLATGAANFAGTVTVRTTGDIQLGTITVGGELRTGTAAYALALDGGNLTARIQAADTAAPEVPTGFVQTVTGSNVVLDWLDTPDIGTAGLGGYRCSRRRAGG